MQRRGYWVLGAALLTASCIYPDFEVAPSGTGGSVSHAGGAAAGEGTVVAGSAGAAASLAGGRSPSAGAAARGGLAVGGAAETAGQSTAAGMSNTTSAGGVTSVAGRANGAAGSGVAAGATSGGGTTAASAGRAGAGATQSGGAGPGGNAGSTHAAGVSGGPTAGNTARGGANSAGHAGRAGAHAGGAAGAYVGGFAGSAAGGAAGAPNHCGSQRLANPNFESGETGWSFYSDLSASIVTDENDSDAPVTAHTAPNYAWLGGYDDAYDWIEQDVAIVGPFNGATLVFYYRIETEETTSTEIYDEMVVEIIDEASGHVIHTVSRLSNLDSSSSWIRFSFPVVGAYAGTTLKLRFTVTTDGADTTNFLVDTVSLTLAAC